MKDYKQFCIDSSKTLRDAMKQLDETSRKILFVTDGGKLTASLTDGDLRRFLLAGGTLDDAVWQAAHKSPRAAANGDEAAAFLNNAQYVAVPIVSYNGEIVDIAFPDEQQAVLYPQLGVPVVIMAGGKGSRLEPYTKVLPKPLIPVGELPIIEQIMQRFMQYGCTDFHVIVNYKKQLIKAYFNENEQTYDISWYDEDQPLGTGGGLYLLKGKLNETFILSNCDALLLADYGDILKFHRENQNAITMICAYKNLMIPYGVVEMGDNGVIKSMREKPVMSFLTNTGMYIVESEVLNDIADGVAMGFPDIVEAQRDKGRRVAVYPISEGDWLDMGQFAELEKMREALHGE